MHFNKPKYILLLVLCYTLFTTKYSYGQQINIIPKPQNTTVFDGDFKLDKNLTIATNKNNLEVENLASYLVEQLQNLGLPDIKTVNYSSLNNTKNSIVLQLDTFKSEVKEESYQLNISRNGIFIKANSLNGLFYGVQSLLQLIETPQNGKSYPFQIPFCEIIDSPTFSYRGMHLDTGRRFYSVDFIKKYLDIMAMHKLNTFHWHLTEDQGWRLEIKKYPKLTTIGAQRKQTSYDGKPSKGYYSQEDVKEILTYAKSRYITVIPEIEMPGHAVAALAAYPELSCTGGPFEVETNWGVFKDVFCAGNEDTFHFLEGVLDEVIDLFPSEYIHIGGDEVPKDRWKKCAKCQLRIQQENLKDEAELQSYFIQRIQKYLNKKGRKIIGWDEILEGGLAPNATVMSWRGEEGGIASAKLGHNVIMAPDTKLYFNYFQGDPNYEPHTIGKQLKLSTVYNYNPIPEALSKDEQKFIIGAQACLWTERIPTPKETEYMLLPRLSALSEVLWTNPNKKDLNNFMSRLQVQMKRYQKLNYNNANSVYDVFANNKLLANKSGYLVKLTTEMPNDSLHYTLDGSIPNQNSKKYNQPILIHSNTTLKAISYKNGKQHKRVFTKKYYIHKAFLKNVEVVNNYMKGYEAKHSGLTDGLTGSTSYGDGKWQGFLKDDFVGVLDLGKKTQITKVACNFLRFPELYLFAPKWVKLYISTDGMTYKEIDSQYFTTTTNPLAKEIVNYTYHGKSMYTRYLKIVAKNIGTNPSWHKTAGNQSRLFVDEVIVE